MLIRFREEKVDFSADIEGMFYQTRVTPSNTGSLRFLWWPESINEPPEEYKMLVHIFSAKSSPCCANKALSMTAQDNEENYPLKVIRTFRRNFYVHDILKSVPNTGQAIPLASDLRKLLSEGGFRLTKFASNRPFAASHSRDTIKTAVLVSKSRTGTSQTKDIHNFKL